MEITQYAYTELLIAVMNIPFIALIMSGAAVIYVSSALLRSVVRFIIGEE